MLKSPILVMMLWISFSGSLNGQTSALTLSSDAEGFHLEPDNVTNAPNMPFIVTVNESISSALQIAVKIQKNNATRTINLDASHGTPPRRFSFAGLQGANANPDSLTLQVRSGTTFVEFLIYSRTGVVTTGNNQPPPTPNPPSNTGDLYKPGNMIFDALRLSAPDIPENEVKLRLNYYCGDNSNSSRYASCIDSVNNKFLADYLVSVRSGFPAQAAATLGLKNILAKAGGLDVTTLVDGLARFLIERTKKELTSAFFSKLKEEMANDKYKDLRLLFPETYTVLQRIDKEIYMFDVYKMTLRQAFEKDLKSLLVHLPDVIEEGRFKPWFDDHKEIKSALLSGLFIYNSLAEGMHPGNVIESYPAYYLDGIPNEPVIRGSVETVQLLSSSLRAVSPDRFWSTPDSVALLFKSEKAINAFMGILWIKSENIKYNNSGSGGATLRDIINQIHTAKATELPRIKEFLSKLSDKARELESTIRQLKKKKDDTDSKLAYEDYHELINQVFDFTDVFVKNLGSLPLFSRFSINTPMVLRYLNVGRMVNNLGLDIATRNYYSGIINLTNLYDTLTWPVPDHNRPSQPLSTSEWTEFKKNRSQIIKDLIHYGTMIAAVADAKDAAEVQKAIESVALPSGSFRVKRESICNVALNAYVGLFFGREWREKSKNSTFINTWGVTAPIGVSIAWGSNPPDEPRANKKRIGGKSNGVFISLIDIGTVTALRFGDTTSTLPTIRLKDIVGPGLYYSHGFGKSPISMNIGAQYGSALRKIDKTEATVERAYWRLSLSVLVDIPLLNFYNKNR